jgi:hypothetical protein
MPRRSEQTLDRLLARGRMSAAARERVLDRVLDVTAVRVQERRTSRGCG